MGDLENLRNHALKTGILASAELSFCRIQFVAAVAVESFEGGEQGAGNGYVQSVSGARTKIKISAALLCRIERVIQASHRIGRREYLQLEVREALHLSRRWLINASHQALERNDEVIE